MKISSKTLKTLAIISFILSLCFLILRISNCAKDYPSLQSELKPIGSSLAFIGIALLYVAKRKKTNESENV